MIYLPLIASADFEAFKALLKDEIAPTFQEWLERRDQHLAFYANDTIVERPVDPNEFARFCGRAGSQYDARALYAFAEFVAEANP